MTCTTDYIEQNRNSDFTIIERFILKGEAQPVDAFDWEIEYFVNNNWRFTAKHKDGVFTNCIKNDDTSVLVIFDSPKFAPGPLNRIARFELPNPIFPDGIENIEIPSRTNIDITNKPSADAGRIESEIVLSYVQGKSGHSPYFNNETDTWWEFDDQTREWVDTGVGGGGGISRAEFDSTVERLDQRDTDITAVLDDHITLIVETRQVADSTAEILITEVARIDMKDTEQDLVINDLGAEVVEIGRVAESTATTLEAEVERIDQKNTFQDVILGDHAVAIIETREIVDDTTTDLATLTQTVEQIQADINGVEAIQDENLSIIG